MLEGDQCRLGWAVQPDHDNHGDAVADRLRFGCAMVAADIAGFFEGADPPQAGRGGDADPLGEFDIGHAPVGLQVGEDLAVDQVELDALHGKFLSMTEYAQYYYKSRHDSKGQGL